MSSGLPLPYDYNSPVAAQQEGAPYKPEFEVVPDSGDDDTILIRVSPEKFDEFVAQTGIRPTYPKKYGVSNAQGAPSQTYSASSPQFNVPSNPVPSPVQFTVPSNQQTNFPGNAQFNSPSSAQFTVPSNPRASVPSSANVQPSYEVQARSSTPQRSQYSAEFQGGGAGRRLTGQNLLVYTSVGQVLRNSPNSAQLINVQPEIPDISKRLPDNYTLIRPNVVDTFRCDNRVSLPVVCLFDTCCFVATPRVFQ